VHCTQVPYSGLEVLISQYGSDVGQSMSCAHCAQLSSSGDAGSVSQWESVPVHCASLVHGWHVLILGLPAFVSQTRGEAQSAFDVHAPLHDAPPPAIGPHVPSWPEPLTAATQELQPPPHALLQQTNMPPGAALQMPETH
jgi:hypothetical protein